MLSSCLVLQLILIYYYLEKGLVIIFASSDKTPALAEEYFLEHGEKKFLWVRSQSVSFVDFLRLIRFPSIFFDFLRFYSILFDYLRFSSISFDFFRFSLKSIIIETSKQFSCYPWNENRSIFFDFLRFSSIIFEFLRFSSIIF